MALAPRTFRAGDPLEEVEDFLVHLLDHLNACPLTAALTPPVAQRLADLEATRTKRRGLLRAQSALQAQRLFRDDDLDVVFEKVKVLLASDKSSVGVALSKDVFEHKPPAVTRRFVLGPQLVMMLAWPDKLGKSTRPEVLAVIPEVENATSPADKLVKALTAAATDLEQFDAGPRAQFVDACNATIKDTYGQLEKLAFTPPAGALIPAGFTDRFILREPNPHRTDRELADAIKSAKEKLARMEAELAERRAAALAALEKQQADQLAAFQAAAEKAKEEADKAAADLAALQAKQQAELEALKNDPE